MTAVFWKKKRSRLSVIIDQPGGISIGVALAQAQANLEALQPESQRRVAEHIADMVALREPEPGQAVIRGLQQAYMLASQIIAAAGPFNRDDLCTAAKGLCDLIDAAVPGVPFDWRIVTVHARALHLILGLPPEAAEGRALVLENLRQMVTMKTGNPDQAVT